MTRLSILNVGIFAVFVSCAHAQTVPVVPAYSPAYELQRTKETLRSKATDARIRRFSDEYEKEKLKDASAKKKDKAPEKKSCRRQKDHEVETLDL